MSITFKRTQRGLIYGRVRSVKWSGDVIPFDNSRASVIAMAEELSGETYRSSRKEVE